MKIVINKNMTLEERLEFQLRILFYKTEPHITDLQISMLIYMYLYPNNYVEKLMKDGILYSKPSVNNFKSQLKYLKLVYTEEVIKDDGRGRPVEVLRIHPKLASYLTKEPCEYVINLNESKTK